MARCERAPAAETGLRMAAKSPTTLLSLPPELLLRVLADGLPKEEGGSPESEQQRMLQLQQARIPFAGLCRQLRPLVLSIALATVCAKIERANPLKRAALPPQSVHFVKSLTLEVQMPGTTPSDDEDLLQAIEAMPRLQSLRTLCLNLNIHGDGLDFIPNLDAACERLFAKLAAWPPFVLGLHVDFKTYFADPSVVLPTVLQYAPTAFAILFVTDPPANPAPTSVVDAMTTQVAVKACLRRLRVHAFKLLVRLGRGLEIIAGLRCVATAEQVLVSGAQQLNMGKFLPPKVAHAELVMVELTGPTVLATLSTLQAKMNRLVLHLPLKITGRRQQAPWVACLAQLPPSIAFLHLSVDVEHLPRAVDRKVSFYLDTTAALASDPRILPKLNRLVLHMGETWLSGDRDDIITFFDELRMSAPGSSRPEFAVMVDV